VSILMEVIAVIVNLDTRETIVKQVKKIIVLSFGFLIIFNSKLTS